MLTLSLPQRALPLSGPENLHRWELILCIVVVVVVVAIVLLLGWARIQGSKWAQSQLPGEERSGREGEGMGQVGGFGNGQVDATIQGYSQGGRTRRHARSRPTRMRNDAFFTNGPVALRIHRLLPCAPNASSWLIDAPTAWARFARTAGCRN